MNLIDQVVSLEVCKKLKELNVKQDSLFYWSKLSIQTEYKLELRTNIFTQEIIFADCTDYISAFTVAELGLLLPPEKATFRIDENDWYMAVINPISKWNEMYPCDTEANARAKMLIYLLKNGLIKNE